MSITSNLQQTALQLKQLMLGSITLCREMLIAAGYAKYEQQ
jgi:hypothetical protein